jgi:D-tagatose-1,6-bisphosphate aldolase subunit GatZ/KbaZ
MLGSDHLGPNPWKHRPASEAMEKAEVLIEAYVEAGFSKLHLDTSMGCRGEPAALAGEKVAERAAGLAAIAERHKGKLDPVYVIGTEVPVPGGASQGSDHLGPTRPEAVEETLAVHEAAFGAHGLQDAFSRVIALVVQPGVEFGNADVVHFDAGKARMLRAALGAHPGIVYEAHSTDYQTAHGLRGLVENGFAILKVGPWLTFALREALYSLDAVADVLDGHSPKGRLMGTMERVMQAAPDNWRNYCSGSETERWLQRHFGLSDRIRYYWPDEAAREAVDALLKRLEGRRIPASVRSQYLADHGLEARQETSRTLVTNAVKDVLRLYDGATRR